MLPIRRFVASGVSSRRQLHVFKSNIAKKLEHYSQFQPSALTIQQYLDFGRNGTAQSSYLFLRKELLVRLANIMQVITLFYTLITSCSYVYLVYFQEINLLPPMLLKMPSTKIVSDWYQQSFDDLLKFEHVEPSFEQITE